MLDVWLVYFRQQRNYLTPIQPCGWDDCCAGQIVVCSPDNFYCVCFPCFGSDAAALRSSLWNEWWSGEPPWTCIWVFFTRTSALRTRLWRRAPTR